MENFTALNEAVAKIKAALTSNEQFNIAELYQKLESAFVAENFRTPDRGGVNSILIFRLDAIGDFILTSAAIRELRANYPSAFITLVVSKGVYSLAEFCPYVNEVLTFDLSKDDVFEFAKKYFWAKRYTLAFNFTYWMSPLNTIFMYLSGAKERIAYSPVVLQIYTAGKMSEDEAKYYSLLTHPVILPKEIINDAARDLYILHSFGLKIRHTHLELWYTAEDLFQAKKILEGFAPGRMKIAIGLGAGNPARHYPVEKYLEALTEIIGRGVSLVIFGGPAEIEDAKFLQENLPAEYVKNICEMKLNWRVTAALISIMDLYLGNDTGAAHCAAAAKVPTITLNPESKERELIFDRGWSGYAIYYPYQNLAIVLRPEQQLENCKKSFYYSGCGENKPHCITQITPEEIVAAFEEMVYFMKFSKIKKTGAPPVLSDSQPVSELFFKLDFK